MTVGELLARISSEELTEWMAFSDLEPFGDERADVRSGIVAATIANANRDPKRKREPFTPRDFMPRFGKGQSPKTEQRWQDQLKVVRQWHAALGGKTENVKRKD